MRQLIECVPNFSEGRDAALIQALVRALSTVKGAWVLDSHSDRDHNRTVITVAGRPKAVAEAAVQGVGMAAKLIDLNIHQGAHPRIGATDVMPFVPVEGVTSEDCVALAHRAGREIWERFQIPVYFYEAAALRPERTALEQVRKGEFEALRREAPIHPHRSPDVGGPELHPTAGAVAVGMRKYLIAYNINLDTADLAIADKLARKVRTSSGGLAAVKALGIALPSRGITQVSMNLTDFEETPLERVYQAVKREVQGFGCGIAETEIIGLIPQRAHDLDSESAHALTHFSPAQILENRLAAVMGERETASAPA